MKNFLENIDLFGEPVKIYLQRKSIITTKFGGLLTILLILIVLGFSWFIGKDILIKQNPFSFQRNLMINEYPPIEINNTIFPFSVAIMDFNNVPIVNDSIITLKLYYILVETNENNVMEARDLDVIDLEPCKIDNFPTLTLEEFQKAQLASTFCPKKQNFTVEGFWGGDKVIYINLAAQMCDYDSLPDYCETHEGIKQFLGDNGANFNVFYLENTVDIKNYSNPINSHVNSFYKYFDTDKYKVSEYNLKTIDVRTDNGLVFEDQDSRVFYKLTEIQTDTSNIDYSSKTLITFTLYSSNVSDIIYRKYLKVAEVLASVGGLIKLFQISFSFFNLGFSRISKFETVINELFEFGTNLQGNTLNKVSILRFSKTQNNINKLESMSYVPTDKLILPINNLHMSHSIQINEEECYVKILQNIKARKLRTKLKLSKRDNLKILLYPIFCPRRLKDKQNLETYLKGENKIKEYFDFLNIIKKIEEHELLKKVILSKNKEIVFEILSLPRLDSFENNFNNHATANYEEIVKDIIREIKNSNTPFDINFMNLMMKK